MRASGGFVDVISLKLSLHKFQVVVANDFQLAPRCKRGAGGVLVAPCFSSSIQMPTKAQHFYSRIQYYLLQ